MWKNKSDDLRGLNKSERHTGANASLFDNLVNEPLKLEGEGALSPGKHDLCTFLGAELHR